MELINKIEEKVARDITLGTTKIKQQKTATNENRKDRSGN